MWQSVVDSGRRSLLRRRALLLLTLALAAVAGSSSCRPVAPVVKIGLVAPFEGRGRAVGYDALYAARLAVRQYNQAATGTQFRVALVALDDGGDPRQAREAAAGLLADPDLLVVLGHWFPETTAAASRLYAREGLPLLSLGAPPLTESDPALLPDSFREAYAALTPFAETAGAYAGATYDGVSLALAALELAESEGTMTRAGVAAALDRLQYEE